MNDDYVALAGAKLDPKPPGPGARVALYSRFGALPQRATSLNDQITVGRAYAGSRGWNEVCAEIESGRSDMTTIGRPGLEHVLELAHQGAIDVVLVDKVERLSRDARELEMLVRELQRCKVVFCTIQDGVFGTDHPRFELPRLMEMLTEQNYRDVRRRKRERTTAKVRADAAC